MERGEYMPCAGDAAWQVIGTVGALKPHMIGDNPKKILRCTTTTENGVETDVLFEEDEALLSHPRSPYVRVDSLPSSRHVRVEVDGAEAPGGRS